MVDTKGSVWRRQIITETETLNSQDRHLILPTKGLEIAVKLVCARIKFAGIRITRDIKKSRTRQINRNSKIQISDK